MKNTAAAAALLTILLALGAGRYLTPAAGAPAAPGELLFRLTPGPGGSRLTAVTSRIQFFAGMAEVNYNRQLDLWRVRVAVDGSIDSVVAALTADPGASFVQRNYIYTNQTAPNDPLYRQKQHPYYAAVDAQAAWSLDTSGSPVIVAVVDGGVDVQQPELDSKIWRNPGEVQDGIDNDGNGCIDDVHGCDFQASPADGNVRDLDGHGTFVSGIIGAESDNGKGVGGVAWKSVILTVRALDSSGKGTTEQLSAGIQYAAKNGAKVINLSLALAPEGGVCPTDAIVDDVLRQAHDQQGVTIVAAAGNFDLPCVAFPGSSAYTIAVSASGPPSDPDIRAFFSHWGPEVDVTAPGIDIISTCPVPTALPTNYCPGTDYGAGSGTSFSTPIVAGAAALMLSHDPALTNERIRQRLRETALDLPDGNHPNWDGAGRIDLGAALGVPAVFAAVDLNAPDISELELAVTVGPQTHPLCRAAFWDAPVIPGNALHGSFGAGECGEYWPPSVSRPWSLTASTAAGKEAWINDWGVRRGSAYCSSRAGAAGVSAAAPALVLNECSGTRVVENDTADGATVLDSAHLPLHFEQDLLYATAAGDPALSCAPSFSRSVWYRIDATGQPEGISADTFGSSFDTVLAVFKESPSGLVEVGCNDQFASAQSKVSWQADGKSTYFVLAAAFQTLEAGRLKINLNPAFVPKNESPEDALQLPANTQYPLVEPAQNASPQADNPGISCAFRYRYSLWFHVSSTAGQTQTATSEGSDYDTAIAVFAKNSDGTMTEVACNDEASSEVHTSLVSWQAAGYGRRLRRQDAGRLAPGRTFSLAL
ncbi:MAG: hypothetical protein E6J42_04885 [Chloroflexi bacterium]|nr:MAG: hypothetical protein E6J42_04885 [Chloroflexota bacterium]